MSKGKTAQDDGTHWVYEHRCPAKTSEITGASEEADVVMAGAGVADRAKA
jgi:hypothetical protein